MSDQSELLLTIRDLLQDVKSEQLLLKQKFFQAIDDSKTRDEKMRGEIRSLQGEVKHLEGSLERMNGNVIVLSATIEELERGHAQVRQEVSGLTQLAMTNFDQNASILEELTGTKGADRPQRIVRPSNPG